MNPTARHITEGAAQRHGVTVEEILSGDRTKRVSHARQEAYYQVRQFDPDFYSYPNVAKQFGRTHAAVIYGIRRHLERAA